MGRKLRRQQRFGRRQETSRTENQIKEDRGTISGDQILPPPPTAIPQCPPVGDQPNRLVSRDGSTDPPRRSDRAEGDPGDSTSRDIFNKPPPDIYGQDKQTSIVTFLTTENKGQRYQEDGLPATKEGCVTRSRQVDSDMKRKKNKKNLSQTPSSDKMKKLMMNFVTKKEGDNIVNKEAKEGEEDTGPNNDIRKVHEDDKPVVEVVEVSRKQPSNFPSTDVRMKTTFTSSVRDRVNAIESDVNVKCVLGSGRCATHNNKLIRGVTKKRYSCINPATGGLMWKFRDVTSMECPGRTKRTRIAPDDSDVSVSDSGGNNNNKKFRLDEK